MISVIVSFKKQSAEHRIKLLLLQIPTKASIYPEMLTQRAKKTDASVYSHTAVIISRLRDEGVEIVDLFEVFSEAKSFSSVEDNEYYLVQDSHWSTEGIRLAAMTVAKQMTNLGWIKKGSSPITSR